MLTNRLSRTRLTAATLTVAILLVSGCQTTTYERSPLPDAASHLAEFGRLDDARLQPSSQADFSWRDGLTVDEGEWVALVYNPDLRLLRLEADIAAAVEEYAALRDDPSIGVDLMRLFSGVPNPWIAVASVAASLPVSGRLPYQQAVAEAETEAALMRAVEAEWRVRGDLRQAWLAWSTVKQRQQLVSAFDKTLADFIARGKKWQEAGEFQGREIALLEIDRRELAIVARRLEREAREQAAVIRSLMGLSPVAEYELLPMAMPETVPVAAIDLRAERNPTLRRLRAEYEAAERQVALEVKKQKPDLGIGSEVESDEGEFGLGFGTEVTLPIFNGNRAAIAAARGERQLRAGRYAAAIEHQTNEIARLQARRTDLAAELAMLADIQPLIDAEIETATKQLQLGELDGFVLVESLQKVYATRLDQLDRSRELALTNLQLQHLHWPTESFTGDDQ